MDCRGAPWCRQWTGSDWTTLEAVLERPDLVSGQAAASGMATDGWLPIPETLIAARYPMESESNRCALG
jgi:hypothetical protein